MCSLIDNQAKAVQYSPSCIYSFETATHLYRQINQKKSQGLLFDPYDERKEVFVSGSSACATSHSDANGFQQVAVYPIIVQIAHMFCFKHAEPYFLHSII